MDMTIGDFLLRRLQEFGIRHLFGVPGDYNLTLLEQVEALPQLRFIGNCNELNAAYAADGYARTQGFGAVLTTYGVGDLSALNGIAGAYAERVPVIMISGMPPLHAIIDRALMHHTLCDGNYDNIMVTLRQFTVAQARITVENAAQEIDRVLQTCFRERRPVYLQLPSDLACLHIEVPQTPLQLSETRSEPGQLLNVVTQLQQRLASASNPVLLVDIDVERFGLTAQVLELIERLELPFANLPPAKAMLPESHPLFLGTYAGAGSAPSVREAIEQADCVISIGARFTDTSTALFSQKFKDGALIQLQPYAASLGKVHYNAVSMRQVLEKLVQQPPTLRATPRQIPPFSAPPAVRALPEQPLSQLRFWQRIAHLIKGDELIIAESGTSSAGLNGLRMPSGVTYITQPIWGSIGYTLPALLGSLLAQPERRQMLFIGDGSLQMTVQELSTILAHQLKPVIFLINNDGYTIERLILGENSSYNDINPWRYAQLPQVLDTRDRSRHFTVHTEDQLEAALVEAEGADTLVFIEVVMERMDAPESLKRFARLFAEFDYGLQPLSQPAIAS
ncbi:alpha-keto acid decarboxylase family protein [Pseudomonas sp. SBB6]|uniref:alpha-keto acid decarboxylase family protein n=1 Tax=Pseudomonas sp. SBB6 TaxID=2962032 RepID=UPI0020B7D4DC|nr:thiamine pyrophosphate-binding protein [Pseudomonas sp. SBB6]MCP3752364.1 thiamine pyrophosphate-binding protein [Pseudomonas sp. SBB6]